MAEFIELNDENFVETLKSIPMAVVDYYATWCGACRMAAPMFRRVTEEAGIPIYKVDAENNPEARSQVTIENLPTLAVFAYGELKGTLCTTKEEGFREFLRSTGAMK